jgi:hypothetical protein
MASYVILIKFDHEGAHLDSCLDVTPVVALGGYENVKIVQEVRKKFGQPVSPDLAHLGHQMHMLELRSRFDGACDGPFVLHVPDPMTVGEIDQILKDPALLKRIREGRI